MPSSTSSSNARLPHGGWGRSWLLALAVAAVPLVGYEAFWRGKGFRPEPRDDAGLWMLARSRVRGNDPRQVVLLGTSQIQADLDLGVFAEVYGREPAQLGVFNSSPTPVIEHLSRDESFRGVILCDVVEWSFYQGMYPGVNDERQAQYVRKYEHRPAEWWLEESLSQWVHRHLVLRQTVVGPANVWRSWRQGRWPDPPLVTTTLDRAKEYHFPADYPRKGPEDYAGEMKQGPASTAALDRDLPKLRERVERITRRGGKFILVGLPVSPAHRAMLEVRFPRTSFWDRLVRESGATGAVYFADHPELSKFDCSDGSHLDARDRAAFTRGLLKVLDGKL